MSPVSNEKVADVLHSEMLRDLRPGAPIRSQDVRPAVLVKRGQSVLLTVGLELATRDIAVVSERLL